MKRQHMLKLMLQVELHLIPTVLEKHLKLQMETTQTSGIGASDYLFHHQIEAQNVDGQGME